MRWALVVLLLGCQGERYLRVWDAGTDADAGADAVTEPASEPQPEVSADVPLPICDITQAANNRDCPGTLGGHPCMTNCALPDCLLMIPSSVTVWRCVPTCEACR